MQHFTWYLFGIGKEMRVKREQNERNDITPSYEVGDETFGRISSGLYKTRHRLLSK